MKVNDIGQKLQFLAFFAISVAKHICRLKSLGGVGGI